MDVYEKDYFTMQFSPPDYLTWMLIIFILLIIGVILYFIIDLAIKSHKMKIVTGKEDLIGSEGVVLTQHKEMLVVQIMGELWEASSSHLLHPGDKIKVTKIKGLELTVEPIKHDRHTHTI